MFAIKASHMEPERKQLSDDDKQWLQKIKNEQLGSQQKAHGKKVMQRAALASDWDAVELLVKKGVKASASVFNSAIINGRYALIETLLDYGSKPEGTDKNTGKSPLHVAAENHKWEILSLLLSSINELPKDFHNIIGELLSTLVREKQWDIIKILINQKNVDIDTTFLPKADGMFSSTSDVSLTYDATTKDWVQIGNSLLSKAVDTGQWKKVIWLLDQGASIDNLGPEGVLKIARAQQWDLVQRLLDQNLILDAKSKTVLLSLTAASKDRTANEIMVNLVENKGVNVNNSVGSIYPLISALEAFRWDNVRYLINHGADVLVVEKQNKNVWNKLSNVPDDIIDAVKDAKKLAALKQECDDYLKRLNVRKNKTAKDNSKISQLTQLINICNDSKIPYAQRLENFYNKFNESRHFTVAPDNAAKKFKRAVKAIFSLGIYALARGTSIGSPQFWKARREIFIENIVTIKNSPAPKK